MAASQDLFTSAMSGGNIRRYGEMVVVAMPNMGMVTSHQELRNAQAWARGKLAGGPVHKDRARFVERFETVIGRVGSGCATRGGNKALGALIVIMKQSGMNLDAWMIPRWLMDEVFPPRVVNPPKKVVDTAADAPAEAPVAPV